MTTKKSFDDLDPKINEFQSFFKQPGKVPECVKTHETISSFKKVDDGYYEGQYLNREKNGWGRLYVQTDDGYVYTEGYFRNNQLNGYALTIDQEGYCLITEYRYKIFILMFLGTESVKVMVHVSDLMDLFYGKENA